MLFVSVRQYLSIATPQFEFALRRARVYKRPRWRWTRGRVIACVYPTRTARCAFGWVKLDWSVGGTEITTRCLPRAALSVQVHIPLIISYESCKTNANPLFPTHVACNLPPPFPPKPHLRAKLLRSPPSVSASLHPPDTNNHGTRGGGSGAEIAAHAHPSCP